MSKILIEDINKLLSMYQNKTKIKIDKIGIVNIVINVINKNIEIFLETQTKIFKIELIEEKIINNSEIFLEIPLKLEKQKIFKNKIIKINKNDEKDINLIIKQLISYNSMSSNWKNFMYQK